MARTMELLVKGFEDIKVLQQYLYLSKEHFIEVKNSIDVPLKIRMGDDLKYYCKNLNFPAFPEIDWSDRMTNETMLAIISQLRESKPVEYPNHFSNRWEEIEGITMMNASK